MLIPPLLYALLGVTPAVSLQIPLLRDVASDLAPSPSPPLDVRPTSPSSDQSQRSDGPTRPQRTLHLRHAVHLPLQERHLPPSRRDYHSAEIESLAVADPAAYYPFEQAVKIRRIRAQRPASQAAFQAARRASFAASMRTATAGDGTGTFRGQSRQQRDDARLARTLEWEDIEIDAPDVTSVETLAALGKMTSNAYSLPEEGTWYDVGGGWNVVRVFPRLRRTRALVLTRHQRRATRSAGRRTAFEDTSLPTRRTRLSSLPSRAPARSSSAEADEQGVTIRSTCAMPSNRIALPAGERGLTCWPCLAGQPLLLMLLRSRRLVVVACLLLL